MGSIPTIVFHFFSNNFLFQFLLFFFTFLVYAALLLSILNVLQEYVLKAQCCNTYRLGIFGLIGAPIMLLERAVSIPHYSGSFKMANIVNYITYRLTYVTGPYVFCNTLYSWWSHQQGCSIFYNLYDILGNCLQKQHCFLNIFDLLLNT